MGDRVSEPDPLVLGLSRGGVPVAFEVARSLHAELDIIVVRKLGLPGREELAIGAVASGGVRVLNEQLIAEVQLSPQLIQRLTEAEEQELKRREELYRAGRSARAVSGRTVIVVDDGFATGASMKAATQAVRARLPKRVVAAFPVAVKEAYDEFRMDVDEAICRYTPQPFFSVGAWYEDFSQTSDDEVRQLLEMAARPGWLGARHYAVR
ncbi:MAG: phosphoribosyltransferase [Bryobacteraceae bacterium]